MVANRMLFNVLLMSIVVMVLISCGRNENATKGKSKNMRLIVDEKNLGETPEKFLFLDLCPQNGRIGYVVEEKGNCYVIIDGKEEGGPYDNVYVHSDKRLFFADGKHFAFAAERAGKHFTVVDGHEGKKYDGIAGPFFSSDGSRWVYVGWRGKKHLVIEGETESMEYDAIGNPIFSPNGQHLAFAAQHGYKWSVVVDGKEGKTYDVITDPVFSPDSKRLAYCVKRNGKDSIILDGTDGPEHEGIKDGQIVFSPDSQRLAYVALENEECVLVVDGKEVARYVAIWSKPIFSTDSRHIAYIAGHERDYTTTFFAHEGFGADGIQLRPGKSQSYPGRRQFISIDGHASHEYDRIAQDSLIFSPDGRRVGYIAERSNKWFAVVDENEGEAYAQVKEFIFSPDSKRFAYAACQGDNWIVVTDGIPSKKYEYVASLTFGPDSSHIAFYAVQNQKGFIVLDGLESREYDNLFSESRPVFETADSLRTITVRNRRFILVQLRIADK